MNKRVERPTQSAIAYGYDADRLDGSASVIAPLLMQLFSPKTVLDLGCGLGEWLAELQTHGAVEIMGYDGAWVPQANLRIPANCFEALDFYRGLPRAKRYDLSICSEVAEHVSSEVGNAIVNYLYDCSDLVVVGSCAWARRP